MQSAWGQVAGIGVDVHVHRISGRLRWTKHAADPERTREQLEAWLPKDKWEDVNLLMVGLGQTVCTALRPRCDDCLIGIRGLCPSAPRNVRNKATEGQQITVGGDDNGDGDDQSIPDIEDVKP